jgi:DNA (cytosine-5)-methyltransferase 1
MTLRIGSLFSGAGGLDRAVEAVFGGSVVWHSEIDLAASKVLAYRFPGVPNLGDITQVNWSNWKPMLEVDVLCGGFPCTDVSAAGKRAGMHGTRSGLWSEFAKAIDILRPRMVVIENVRGLLSAHANRPMESDDVSVGDGGTVPVLRAAGAVLGDLADLGYDAQWTTLAAGDVGAPHRRERVFILAFDGNVSHAGHDARRPEQGIKHEIETGRVGQSSHGATSDTGNARQCGEADYARGREFDLAGRGSGSEPSGRGASREGGPGSEGASTYAASQNSVASPVELLPTPTAVQGRNETSGRQEGSQHHSGTTLHDVVFKGEIGQALLPTPNASDCTGGGAHPDAREGHSRQLIDFALLAGSTAWGKYEPAIRRWEQIVGPAPAPTEPNKNNNPRLSAAFSEWLMGWPAGWVTDPAIGISRNNQLRIVGNGVCSQQAAAALRYLLGIATDTHTHSPRAC